MNVSTSDPYTGPYTDPYNTWYIVGGVPYPAMNPVMTCQPVTADNSSSSLLTLLGLGTAS